MVPATAPLRRFDPGLVAWHGKAFQPRGDTAWTIEALHLNDGRRLYISDLVGHVQLEWTRRYRRMTAGGIRGEAPGDAGAAAVAAATAAAAGGGNGSEPADQLAEASGLNAAVGGGRRHRGGWRGLHMQRTCKILEKKGLVEWPDGCGDAGGGGGGGGAGAGSAADRTAEAVLPGGVVVRTVRRGDAKRKPRDDNRLGRPPRVALPRLTPAGRIVWMQTRLGLSPRDALVLAMIWPPFKRAGYFVKSDSMVLENVWMSKSNLQDTYYSLGRAGYIRANQKTGRFLAVHRADTVEPYGPMLEVIEEMVYGARAGEYVYGNTYDDEINRAYAKTVAALGEGSGSKGAGGGGAD